MIATCNWLGSERFALRIGAQAGVEQARAEPLRLRGRVEGDRMLGGAGRAEVVGLAAHGQHQRVVGEHAARQHFVAGLLVQQRREQDRLVRAIETFHAAELEIEVVPARLGEVVELVVVLVHAAGGHLVQQRLPQVRARAVDERDARPPLRAEPVAEAGGELESARAAADDHDAVPRGALRLDSVWIHADVLVGCKPRG